MRCQGGCATKRGRPIQGAVRAQQQRGFGISAVRTVKDMKQSERLRGRHGRCGDYQCCTECNCADSHRKSPNLVIVISHLVIDHLLKGDLEYDATAAETGVF